MKKYLVTRTIKLTHTVEANSKAEALLIAADLGEHTSDASVTETVKLLHNTEPRIWTGSLHSGGFPIHGL